MKRMRLLHDILFGMLAFIVVLGFLCYPPWVDGQVRKARYILKPKPVEVYHKLGSERSFVLEPVTGGFQRVWFTSPEKMKAWCDKLNYRPRMVVLSREVELKIEEKLILSSPKNR